MAIELTWPKIISGAFALTGAVAVAVWQVRADRIDALNEQIAALEQAVDLNLSGTLKDVNEANSQLSERIARLGQLESLGPKLKAAQDEIVLLRGEIKALNQKVSDYEVRFAKADAKRGKLRIWEGRTQYLGDEQVILGVTEVNNATHTVKIRIDGEQSVLEVGQLAGFVLNDLDCKLTIDNTAFDYSAVNSYADVSYRCMAP